MKLAQWVRIEIFLYKKTCLDKLQVGISELGINSIYRMNSTHQLGFSKYLAHKYFDLAHLFVTIKT